MPRFSSNGDCFLFIVYLFKQKRKVSNGTCPCLAMQSGVSSGDSSFCNQPKHSTFVWESEQLKRPTLRDASSFGRENTTERG